MLILFSLLCGGASGNDPPNNEHCGRPHYSQMLILAKWLGTSFCIILAATDSVKKENNVESK